MRVAGVIVTYNRKKLLLESIEAMLHQTKSDCLDIIVVDNNSSDGTVVALDKYIRSNEIIYRNTGANLGGAGGFQYGIRYAVESGYDYIWLMDDDCIPSENALEELLRADMELNNTYGFLASKVLWQDNSICKMNVQKQSLWKKVSDWHSDRVEVIMSSFVSLFIPSKNVIQLGMPIKEFFIWTDDWEYTRRMSRYKKSYLVNSSIVVHKAKNNFGANIALENVERLDRYRYLYRNDMYLYKREGIEGLLYQCIRLINHSVRVIFKSKNLKCKRLKIIYVNTYKGFSFNPPIEFPNM